VKKVLLIWTAFVLLRPVRNTNQKKTKNMKLFIRNIFAGAILALASLTTASAYPTNGNLQDLVTNAGNSGGYLTGGSLTFYNFISSIQTDTTGLGIQLSDFGVQAFANAVTGDGLTLQSIGNLNIPAGKSFDLRFQFYVSSPTPITSNILTFAGTRNDPAGNIIISETVLALPSLDQLSPATGNSVDCTQAATTLTYSSASTDFWVQKDIAVVGGAETTTSLSDVNQYFEPVPEPSSFALIGLGVAGVALMRRKLARK